jgi:hypothetical protein
MPMKIPALLTAATLLLAGTAGAGAASRMDRVERNEARLAELLRGRTAGEPVSCIPQFVADRAEVIEGVAIVYGRGQTLYVARLSNPRSPAWSDVVVTLRNGSMACHNDIMHTVDRMTGIMTGAVFLQRFVPYRRQD